MSTGTIQFRGKQQVLDAFKHKEIPAWSMWQGKVMLHKYEGDDVTEAVTELDTWLTMMGESSNAIYTIKVYEELQGKIKENTPCDGSFNFRLNMEGQLMTPTMGHNYERREALIERMERIEKLLTEDIDDTEDNDEEPDTIGRVKEILEMPIVSGLINKLFGLDLDTSKLGKVGNAPNENTYTMTNEEKINAAIVVLQAKDPKLGDHLMKLAEVAKSNPIVFSMILKKVEDL